MRYTASAPTASKLEDPVDVNRVRNHRPYAARLKAWEPTVGSYNGNPERRIIVDWELIDAGGSVRDWLGCRLGQQHTGQVSKLRRMLNALADEPESTAIDWFDDESGEWAYEGEEVHSLRPGVDRLNVLGKIVPLANGQGLRFQIEIYEPDDTDGLSGVVSRAARVFAQASAGSEDYPF
jgi:hypothetical protein